MSKEDSTTMYTKYPKGELHSGVMVTQMKEEIQLAAKSARRMERLLQRD